MVSWILAFSLSLLLNPASAQFSLKVLHMNDHHSHLESETFTVESPNFPPLVNESLAGTDVTEIDVTYGGFPYLITLFDKLASESETPVLKLHAGDAFAGTLFFTLFQGIADSDMMNFVCFDAMTLGNHEFDSGDAVLADFLTTLKNNTMCPDTPVLSANLMALEDSPVKPLILPYTIQDFEGEQVAIIGITTSTTTATSSPELGTVFMDEVETAEATIAEVTDMGVNKIIMLTHVGYDLDVSLMAELEGVDVVVGGHTHSLLGENVDLLKSSDGPFPTVITHTTGAGGTVCVVQAWEYGHGLGDLDVEFDESGNVISCSGGPKFAFDATGYDPELEEDAALAMTEFLEGLDSFIAVAPSEAAIAELDELSLLIDEFGEDVIATVPEPGICFERIPGQGRSEICTPEETISNGGGACNLVAQAFLDNAKTADIALQNAGGCRTDINPGNYTINDAFVLLPFQNTLVSLEMTGEQIVLVLNQAVDFAYSGSTGAYPYAAGIRYDVDANAEFPSKVVNVEVNVRLMEMEWSPIDLEESYTVVTNSFIAAGRDGYLEFAEVPDDEITDLFLEYANAFVVFAQKVGVLVDPPIETYSTQNFVPLVETPSDTPSMTPSDLMSDVPVDVPVDVPSDMPASAPVDVPSDMPASAPVAPPAPPTSDGISYTTSPVAALALIIITFAL